MNGPLQAANSVDDDLPDLAGKDFRLFLEQTMAWLKPKTYLEIVSDGAGMSSRCLGRAIQIHVGNQSNPNLVASSQENGGFIAAFQMKSDEFFERVDVNRLLDGRIDFAFIDGTHLCDYVLGEFINIERRSAPGCVIAIHDCVPVEMAIAGREFTNDSVVRKHRRNWWVGDVWRVILLLRQRRPDLTIRVFDCSPSGLALITGLDSSSKILENEYADCVTAMLAMSLPEIGISRLHKKLEVVPSYQANTNQKFLRYLGRGMPTMSEVSTREAVSCLDEGAELALAKRSFVHKQIAGARVQAYRPPSMLKFVGGIVFDGDLPEDHMLRHTRSGVPQDSFDKYAEYARRIDGHFCLAGPLYHYHFGHFISEMVHRIVPSKVLFGNTPLLFIADQNSTVRLENVQLPVRSILRFLDVDFESAIVLAQDARVEMLSICQSGSDLGGGPIAGYLDLLRNYSQRRLAELCGGEVGHPRVYVSRSLVAHGGNFLGETYIEEILRLANFTIFHPEQHPLHTQMYVYSQAKILVFPEGSAIHGCELIGSEMLGQVHYICKRPGHRQIFERVLQNRAQELHVHAGHFYIGSLGGISGAADAAGVEHLGVFMFDRAALLGMLTGQGWMKLSQWDETKYRSAIEKELDAYISFWAQRFKESEDAEAKRFMEAVKLLKGKVDAVVSGGALPG